MSPDVFGLVVAMSDGGLRLGYKLGRGAFSSSGDLPVSLLP